jgi:hypothetical protein
MNWYGRRFQKSSIADFKSTICLSARSILTRTDSGMAAMGNHHKSPKPNEWLTDSEPLQKAQSSEAVS